MKGQAITKVNMIHPLGILNVWAKCQCSCWDKSVRTGAQDRPPDWATKPSMDEVSNWNLCSFTGWWFSRWWFNRESSESIRVLTDIIGAEHVRHFDIWIYEYTKFHQICVRSVSALRIYSALAVRTFLDFYSHWIPKHGASIYPFSTEQADSQTPKQQHNIRLIFLMDHCWRSETFPSSIKSMSLHDWPHFPFKKRCWYSI